MVDRAGMIGQLHLKIDGQDASDDLTHALLDATIETSLHLSSVATLVLHDQEMRWVDDPSLLPGADIVVAFHDGRAEQPLFDGEVVELEPQFGATTHRLVVRAFDRLHLLSRGRKTRSFLQMSDADLVAKLASEVKLRSNVGPSPVVHPYVLQHNQTNLEFLRERAAALGYLLFVRGSTLHCEPPTSEGTAVELRFGDGLIDFRPRLTTLGQVEDVVVRGWDPENRQAIVAQAPSGNGKPQIGEKRSGGELSAEAFHLAAQELVSWPPVRAQAAADALAEARAGTLAGAFVEAEAACPGNPAIQAGTTVSITGVGDRFSGDYLVTGATHTWGLSGLRTQFTVSGRNPTSLLGILGRAAGPRDRAPIGLVIGIVTDNQDPLDQGRVKVMFPWLSEHEASDWARVVAPGAGAERGIQFLPEVNDEVLVGFELGDIRYPYVLGGLWNGHDAPPLPSGSAIRGGQVLKRVIRSRRGHVITLDDTDGAGGITIEDRAGNVITLDTASNTLKIEVLGNASVSAQGNLSLTAQGQIELKGMGVRIEASAAVDVKGSIINLN